MKRILLIFPFLIISLLGFSQNLTQEKLPNNLVSNSQSGLSDVANYNLVKVNSQEPEIIIISEENDVVTYSINNNVVSTELFNNSKKRDEMLALPGFFELGLFSSGKPMRVKIDVDYATEYLEEYFGSKKSNISTQLNE